MSFIRTKEIPRGSGNYYDYEVRSIREGDKVRQEIIKYLGPSAKTNKKLKQLEKRRKKLHRRLETDVHSTEYIEDYLQDDDKDLDERNERYVSEQYDAYEQRKKDREELQEVEEEIANIKAADKSSA
jgi:predicted  nucleic acid-binding Zn-ribbon protein